MLFRLCFVLAATGLVHASELARLRERAGKTRRAPLSKRSTTPIAYTQYPANAISPIECYQTGTDVYQGFADVATHILYCYSDLSDIQQCAYGLETGLYDSAASSECPLQAQTVTLVARKYTADCATSCPTTVDGFTLNDVQLFSGDNGDAFSSTTPDVLGCIYLYQNQPLYCNYDPSSGLAMPGYGAPCPAQIGQGTCQGV